MGSKKCQPIETFPMTITNANSKPVIVSVCVPKNRTTILKQKNKLLINDYSNMHEVFIDGEFIPIIRPDTWTIKSMTEVQLSSESEFIIINNEDQTFSIMYVP